MSFVVKLDKGWLKLSKALDPKVNQKLLELHVGRATAANGLLVRKKVREYIKEGVPTKDGFVGVAELTEYIKHDKKPIVGTPGADLFNSISSNVVSWSTVEVGVKRTEKTANVAEVVHEGRVITVTPKMETMFFYLWLADLGRLDPSKLTGRAKEIWEWRRRGKKKSTGYRFRKLTQGTLAIPPRPYIRNVIESGGVKSAVYDQWAQAVKRVLHDMAQGKG